MAPSPESRNGSTASSFFRDPPYPLPSPAAFGYFAGMKRFVALVGLALAVVLSPAHAQQNPDDQYLAVYNQIQQADALQAGGQPQMALTGYKQALEGLQKFQKKFPQWGPEMVGYRLNYLADKIKVLTAPAPAGSPSTPMPASATVTAAVLPASPATNAVSAAPVSEAEIQLNTLRSQAQGLQAENEMLQAKLKEALRAQPAAPDVQELSRAQAQVLSLMKENDLLRASLNTNGAGTGDLLKARQALADANQKLAEQTSRAGKLAQDNQALQSAAGVSALEKAALEDRLRQRPAAATAAPGPAGDEVKTLRARLAVAEAPAVPYTPEELALMKAPAPALAANAGGGKKSPGGLPSGSAALVAEAQKYFSAGDFGKAEAAYRQILQRDPANAVVLANLAMIEMQENKLAEAETHIIAALAQTPDDAYDLTTLGNLKFRQQKYDEALDALSRAAALAPANAEIQNYLGVTLSQKGLRQEAETALRKAIELDPKYAAAQNNLAVIYLSEQPPAAALARWHYQKALDLGQPRNPVLEKKLADVGAPVAP
jgi:tetratricopeptide (TPR) repeat protein